MIIINGGTNDSWSYQLPVGSLDFTLATEDLDTYQFAQAYDKLIRLLKEKYPEAQICCVIGDAVMDASYSDYAKVIRDVCVHYELPYAEVVFADRASLTYDNVHPNVEGMADMAEQIWDALQPYLEPDGQRIRQTSDPRMKIYFPKGKAENSRMVVVCPGGGYSGIPGADGYEGAFWKDLFNEAGYALAVLYYTLPEGDYTKPVGDMENAMKKIRGNAARWKVDTEKVGVMGFSAGGHLASYAATHFTGTAKPDFQVLFYPVITMENGMTHAGSRNKLLGADPSAELVSQFSNEKHLRQVVRPSSNHQDHELPAALQTHV